MRYEIRELGLGGILDQAFKVMKDHLGVLLGITAVLLIPYYVIGGLIQVAMIAPPPPGAAPGQPAVVSPNLLLFSVIFALVGGYVIAPLTNVALVSAIANAYLEKPISIGGAFGRALRRMLPYLWTLLLIGLAFMGGLILLIVPGILALFWFSLATQVVILEDMSGVAAMKRSKRLMAGNIGTIFVLGLLLSAINIGLMAGAAFIPQPHVKAVAVALITGISVIISSAAFVVFYFSCRCKHEQFDLALLAQSVGEKPPGEPIVGDPELQW